MSSSHNVLKAEASTIPAVGYYSRVIGTFQETSLFFWTVHQFVGGMLYLCSV
jgi:hypothetical protein